LACTSLRTLLIPQRFSSVFPVVGLILKGSTVSVLAPSNAAIYKSITLSASLIAWWISFPNVNAPILVLLVWIAFPKNSNIWDIEADFKLRAN
jgi:hypothetical protein